MPEFAVRVVTDVRLDPDDTDAWDALTDALGGHPHHASLSAPDGRFTVQLTVEDQNLAVAVVYGCSTVLFALRALAGRASPEVVSVEVCTPEEFARRVEPVDIERPRTTTKEDAS